MPLDPATIDLAVQQHQAGQLREAELLYRQVLAVEPRHPVALHLLGVIAFQSGQTDAALELIGQAVEVHPGYTDALVNLAAVFKKIERLDEAIGCWQRALDINPHLADVQIELGKACRQTGRLEEAVASWHAALRLMPGTAELYNNLGNALRDLGRLDEAVASLQQAVALKPEVATIHNNLALALRKQGQRELAIASWQFAARLQPDDAELHRQLAGALWEQDEWEQSTVHLREVVRLQPANAAAHNNLGVACRELGRLSEAVACSAHTLWLEPEHIEAHVNLGLAWLAAGNYEQGWPAYQWRWKCPEFSPPPFAQPLWDGTPLGGRTILLYAEQGLGDTLQFVRYAPLVQQRGGRVLLACHAALRPLLARTPGIDQIVEQRELPPFDVHSPLLSLPGLLQTTLHNVPAPIPYLFGNPALERQWQDELGRLPGFKIGIAWQGDPRFPADRSRSLPLTCFAPLARLPGVRLFSLQKGHGREQLDQLSGAFAVTDLGSRLDETSGAFMDTAAVMRCLDLVISIDSALIHLAGGLGVRSWLPLARVPDWRWMLDREDSPWYPTVRLFRQTHRGQWGPVFEQMAHALSTLTGC